MTWGVTFIGQRGQFEIGLKGSLCVGISSEVEFLLDDYDHAAILPVEVKSGKDYTIHRALNAFLANPDYHVHDAYVLSNERIIKIDRFITYLPIYFAPFIRSNHPDVVTLH